MSASQVGFTPITRAELIRRLAVGIKLTTTFMTAQGSVNSRRTVIKAGPTKVQFAVEGKDAPSYLTT